MTESPTVEKKKFKKPPLTSKQKRARTRRKNVVKARAGGNGLAARTVLQEMEFIAASLHKFSDRELSQLKKVVDAMADFRRKQQKVFKSIYERT